MSEYKLNERREFSVEQGPKPLASMSAKSPRSGAKD